jgi:prepilin-type N-terminal cleavage/methylation domain-containing protein
MRNMKHENAFSLIEVLIAIALVALAIEFGNR